MTTKFDVGDDILIKGIVETIYIETRDNEPVYLVRIKGAGTHEAYGIRVKEDVMKGEIYKQGFEEASNEKQKGEWVGNKFDEHYCNKCGNFALWLEEADSQYYEVQSNFCPECGADMRKERMTNKDKGSLEELIQFCGAKKQRSDKE